MRMVGSASRAGMSAIKVEEERSPISDAIEVSQRLEGLEIIEHERSAQSVPVNEQGKKKTE